MIGFCVRAMFYRANTFYFEGLNMYAKLLILALVSIALNGACSTAVPNAASPESAQEAKPAATAEIAEARAAAEKAPDTPASHTRLAVAYINGARTTGNFALNSDAEKATDRALELAPDDPMARKLKASLNLTFHRFTHALELGTQLEVEAPNDSFVLGVITDAHTELGNYEKAVTAAQRLIDQKPASSAYARVAHLRWLHGDHKGAVELYSMSARTADPADKEAQSWCLSQLGDEYWRNGKYAEAEKVYDEALGLMPGSTNALAGKARVRASTNDFEAAANYLSKANAIAPHTHNVILLGDIYTRLGWTVDAAKQYALAEAGEENLGYLHDAHRVAQFWADNGQNLAAALEIAQTDYDTQKDIYAADTLAWCLFKNGKVAEARAMIKEAMRLKTNDAKLYYHAGMIAAALGNKVEARKMIEAAIKLNPSFDLIQEENARNALKALS